MAASGCERLLASPGNLIGGFVAAVGFGPPARAASRAALSRAVGMIPSFGGAGARVPWAGAVLAVAIADVIAWQAVKILVGAFHVLTDGAALPPEMIAGLLAGVQEIRDIRE